MVEHENIALCQMVLRTMHLDIDVDIGAKGRHRAQRPLARFRINGELFAFDLAERLVHSVRYPGAVTMAVRGRSPAFLLF